MLRLDVAETSLLMLALLDSRSRGVKWPALGRSRCLTTELLDIGCFFLGALGAREAFCRAPAWAVSSKSGSTWTLQLPLRMMYMQSPSSPASMHGEAVVCVGWLTGFDHKKLLAMTATCCKNANEMESC